MKSMSCLSYGSRSGRPWSSELGTHEHYSHPSSVVSRRYWNSIEHIPTISLSGHGSAARDEPPASTTIKPVSAHSLKGTPGPEIVAGDMQFDFWLDDRLVTQERVRTALLAAWPALESYPIQLARLVAERLFDLVKSLG